MDNSKLLGLLTRNTIKVAAIQREIVWDGKKIREILSSLLRKKLFLQALWGQEARDEYDYSMYEIYDGLQRYSTMFLIYDSILLECNNRKMNTGFGDLSPSKLLFPSENSQKDWDEAIEYGKGTSTKVEKKTIGRPVINRPKENKKIILNFLKGLTDSELRDFIDHFNQSTWMKGYIPEDEDPIDFYLNMNSKGTAMDPCFVIKTFYKDDAQSFDSILFNIKDPTRRKRFFKCIPLLKEAVVGNRDNDISKKKLIDWFEKSVDKPSIQELNNYANLYMKMLGKFRAVESSHFPENCQTFILKLELLDSVLANSVESLMLDYLIFTLPIQKRYCGGFHQKEEPLFAKLLSLPLDSNLLENTRNVLTDFLKKENEEKNIKGIFDDYFFSNKNFYNNKKLTRFYLKAICEEKYPTIPIALPDDDRTLEHLEKHSNEKEKPWVNDLGNLCLLKLESNQLNGVKDYEAKKASGRYENSGCALTNEITKNREHFTEDDAINLKKDYVETLWKRFTKTFNF